MALVDENGGGTCKLISIPLKINVQLSTQIKLVNQMLDMSLNFSTRTLVFNILFNFFDRIQVSEAILNFSR